VDSNLARARALLERKMNLSKAFSISFLPTNLNLTDVKSLLKELASCFQTLLKSRPKWALASVKQERLVFLKL
jgi:hypothetical protein